MAFRRVQNNTLDADETDLNQYADAFNGTSGKGQPMDLITLDADRYYWVVKNLNANSKCAQLFKQDGTVLLQVDGNGVLASASGGAAGAIAPAASPTFTGIINLSGRVINHRATVTPSATPLTLPTDGNQIPITGTTTISSIVATGLAGLPVTLEFQAPSCRVQRGSNLDLETDFFSADAGATLTLYCDGTNWIEKGRSQAKSILVSLYLTADEPTVNDTEKKIPWDAAIATSNPGGILWAIGSPTHLLAPYTGWYSLAGQAAWEAHASGTRWIAYRRGSAPSTRCDLSIIGSNGSGTRPTNNAIADRVYMVAGDYIEISGQQDRGGALNLRSGDDATRVAWAYEGMG